MSQAEGKDGPDEKALAEAHEFVTAKKEFIQSFFKRASEFTEELLRENERLRYRILELEAQQPAERPRTPTPPDLLGQPPSTEELLERLDELERERERMLASIHKVEQENQDFLQRYRDIERENNNLANLYVASFQLHSTLDLREVRQTIVEILLNLVGAKVFAVFLLDEHRSVLRPLAVEGVDRGQVGEIVVGESMGIFGRVIRTGEMEVASPPAATLDLGRPLIVSPLRIKERVVGAIAIWQFLRQKLGLEDVDYELFNLLAAHAASALEGAKLATELRDKASPLWGAVDLI